MPKNTKVDKCYNDIKGKYGKGGAAAICQSSTKQSLATGKPLPSKVNKKAAGRGR